MGRGFPRRSTGQHGPLPGYIHCLSQSVIRAVRVTGEPGVPGSAWSNADAPLSSWCCRQKQGSASLRQHHGAAWAGEGELP